MTEKIISFCIESPSFLGNKEKKFKLSCKIRNLTQQQLAKDISEFSKFLFYWYELGLEMSFARHVSLNSHKIIQSHQEKGPKSYTILARTEGF